MRSEAAAPISKWWICSLLFLATVLNYMDRMALNQTAPRIKSEFGLSREQYGFLESAFAFAFAFGAIATGILVDRVNVWLLYPIVVLGWSAFGFLTGFVGSEAIGMLTPYYMLLLCRFGLGLFEAGNWPCGIRTTRTILKKEERSLGNAFFQSGTAIGAIITPQIVMLCLAWSDARGISSGWQIPFRFIGILGVLWVILWFLIVPRNRFQTSVEPTSETAASEPFWPILKDRRFWLLVLIIIGVNTPWHAFRVWMPLFLTEAPHRYSERFMMNFSTAYYLCADIGSISVGFITLALVRQGWSVHRSRLFVFGICACITMLSFAVAFMPAGNGLLVIMLVMGFGALGLFPTYFALSQEISGRHQGKITGLLGCINALYLALLFPIQGRIFDATKAYGLGLGFAGIVPLIAFLATWWLWREPQPPVETKQSPGQCRE